MSVFRLIAVNLLLISACVLCFEIIATRISSVIFVNDYAFMILSLSVLGLGAGGIFSYYFLGDEASEAKAGTTPEGRSRSKAEKGGRRESKKHRRDAQRNSGDATAGSGGQPTSSGRDSGGDSETPFITDLALKTVRRTIPVTLILLSATLLIFLLAVTTSPVIENPFFFLFLLILPFFLAGIFYSLIFRHFARHSFRIYAADLVGAASGALLAIAAISYFTPLNAVLFIAVVIGLSAVSFLALNTSRGRILVPAVVLGLLTLGLLLNGSRQFLGEIPIGNFPEKDFHHVYSDPGIRSEIITSRWSITGRSDLVRHSHQDMVRHLFVDGAAGSQMYRFDGNPQNPDMTLQNLLLGFSSTIPLVFLEEDERETMLVIGPGGGKEVLAGLISGVGHITGVEINPDFVRIVEEESDFTGGLYTDFPNVDILIGEGRQYVKQRNNSYDIIKMVLPSTQQVQHIENYALSENYLLTVEALEDYLRILSPEGRLIFTVYNEWELKRLILTAVKAFEARGISPQSVPSHFKVLDDPFAPTIVIKKEAYRPDEISQRLDIIEQIPDGFPRVTYLPYRWDMQEATPVNRFLDHIRNGVYPLPELIDLQPFDVSPVYDNSPFFYKIERGIPDTFRQLLLAILAVNLLVIGIPYVMIRKSRSKKERAHPVRSDVRMPVWIFTCLGLGFMMIEISLFQKMVLYLGTPTVSLSVLLSSLLVGMGIGSYFGGRILPGNHHQRLLLATGLIVLAGFPAIYFYPWLLNQMLVLDLVWRAVTTFFLLLPLGLLLGVPFPTSIRMVKDSNIDSIIPWMYGINGTMSVLGSVLAVVLSMLFGFTQAFMIGLLCYAAIALSMLPRIASKPLPSSSGNTKTAPAG
ncbi:hypothetical protein QA596_02015 [Balneolales bacterium ANBcel1]|nr:hypothetical protein [Balneolales bacterium ANBcel1]